MLFPKTRPQGPSGTSFVPTKTVAKTLLTLFSLLLSSSLLLASGLEGQDLQKAKISLDIHAKSLEFVFREIEKETDFRFAYRPEELAGFTDVTIRANHRSLEEVLHELLTPRGLGFQQKNNYILVGLLPAGGAPEHADVRITGTVHDQLNTPLAGVTVQNLRTGKATATNAKGTFVIEGSPGDSLRFTSVGYGALTQVLRESLVLDITLTPSAGNLEEVVMVAYGKQKKISLVGAQSTVDVGELKQPVANVGTMLAGRIAGIVQVQRSGQPGADGADIWIRGLATFAANGATPLVLIDGVERAIDNIDPQDIASFSVLKDAVSTSVYGLRGANGVILIKTKSGVAGKTKIDVNYNEGVTAFTRLPQMVDGITYMNLANEANVTRGGTALYSAQTIANTQDNKDPLLYPNVNWFKAVFNPTASNRRLNLSATGGSANARYYTSVAYYDESGFFKTDGLEQYNATTRYQRYNFTSNLDLSVTKTTKVELGVQGYISNVNYPGNSPSDIFGQAVTVSPVAYPIMYPGGFVPGRNPNGGEQNPYAMATQSGYVNTFNNQVYSNIRATQDLGFWLRGLSFTSMFSFDVFNQQQISRTKRKSTYIIDPNNPYNPDGTPNLNLVYQSPNTSLGFSNANAGNRRIYTETALNYERLFADKHDVSAMLLYNQSDYDNAFPGDFTSSIPYRSRGLAGRATYGYLSRYFAEFDFGYNGSENFAPARRYGFFPSYGVGWVVSNEHFFKPLSGALSYLKFRWSDGLLGDQGGINRFAYLTILNNQNQPGYTYGNNGQNGIGGTEVTTYGVNVGWAKSRKMDLGMELRTFKSMVSLTVDLFKEHRTDIFLQRQSVPDFVGLYNNPYGNLGIVDNKGIDATVEVPDIAIGKVHLNLRGTATYAANKVIENDQPNQPYPWLNQRGASVLAQWGYVAEGLFTSQDEINKSAVPFDKSTVMPGDIKYKDMNGDGTINAYDMVKISDGDVPYLTWGGGFNLTWKQFNLGSFFEGTGHASRIINGTGIIPFNADGGVDNVYADATNRWTEANPNPNAAYPRLAYGSDKNQNNALYSTYWKRDVGFIRLKTAELGYTLPRGTLKRFGVTNARIYFNGVNLLTFSKFKLWDPELNTGNGTNYPIVKTYSLGANLSF
ncbi:TonB-dependent receptor [Dinghuibacter silviterrae]|uniref:TonB-linked SusC/RagA family outer membrane protein n=1 Tax=Dinghuibacter silviterrae TaxID=1539049 RepID=A0A4R8DHM0_9BACT|nr:TonB-dependent receptor [Dinghuibacter silviterrae]TDW96744.1 TonB-linked SusC/RagA family outer membrane protein [Dinghuibacter silviterrae]